MASLTLEGRSLYEPSISVQVIDARLSVVWTGMVTGSKRLDLVPGDYLVEISGSNGDRRVPVTLDEEDDVVRLVEADSVEIAEAIDLEALGLLYESRPHSPPTLRPGALCASVLPWGRRAAYTNMEGGVEIVDSGLDRPIKLDLGRPVCRAALSLDGQRLVLQDMNSRVEVWDLSQVQTPHPLTVDFDPSGIEFARPRRHREIFWERPVRLPVPLLDKSAPEFSFEFIRSRTAVPDGAGAGAGVSAQVLVSGETRKPTVIALPFRPARIEVPTDPMLPISVTSHSEWAEEILGFLDRRDFDTAQRMAVQALKERDPDLDDDAALVASVAIARAPSSKASRDDWIARYAGSAVDPTPLIALTWSEIYRGRVETEAAARRFITASMGACPRLREGLQLLADGLEWAISACRDPSEATEGLARIREWVDTVDSRSAWTLNVLSAKLALQLQKDLQPVDVVRRTSTELGARLLGGRVVIEMGNEAKAREW